MDTTMFSSRNLSGLVLLMLMLTFVWFNISHAVSSRIIGNSLLQDAQDAFHIHQLMQMASTKKEKPKTPKKKPFHQVIIPVPNMTQYNQQPQHHDINATTSSICNSPELDVPWPLTGSIPSHNPQHTCGLQAGVNPFMDYLLAWNKLYQNDTCDIIVYGVAFGRQHVRDMQSQQDLYRRKRFRHSYGPCFHILLLEKDLGELTSWPDPRMRVMGIPESILPFRNHRRNVKLFKFLPRLLFPNAQTIIWQDAKFFRSREQLHSQPIKYQRLVDQQKEHGSCLTVTSLPGHPWAVGDHWRNTTHPTLRQHCDTIISALQRRPTVTDAPQALMDQCDYYHNHMDVSILNAGMIDTAFMVWHYYHDQQSELPCEDVNARLQCEILNQIHCFSDRDQLAIPYAVGLLNWTKEAVDPSGKSDEDRRNNNTRWYDYHLVDKSTRTEQNDDSSNTKPKPVHVVRSACHWYFHRIGDCPDSDKDPSLAIMVVGTQTRYQMESTFSHVFTPMGAHEHQVDYFVSLSKGKTKLFRKDAGYANLMVHDPFLGTKESAIRDQIYGKLLEFGIRAKVIVTEQGGQYRNDTRIAERFANDQTFSLHSFPSLDLRKSMENMTNVGNSNMLALFYTLEHLWNACLDEEIRRGKEYDYIMILRDDTLWLDDFSLQKILDYGQTPSTNGRLPDAYVLSCDAREPEMLSSEICDHAILVKRSKATVFTKYFSSLLEADLGKCHARAQQKHGFKKNVRGCNSEMILKYVAEVNNVTIQLLPQSLMPFQRAATIQHPNGTIEHCLHKFCQSKDQPLVFPKPLRRCKDIVV